MYALKAIITSGIYVQVIFGVLIFGLIMMIAMAFSKRKKLAYINSYITEFEKTFWSGISLDQYYEANKENLSHPLGLIFKGVMDEWNACAAFRNNIGSKADVKERMLNIAHIKKIETLKVCESYLDFLRLFIHGAPFLGLLGTITPSFRYIFPSVLLNPISWFASAVRSSACRTFTRCFSNIK